MTRSELAGNNDDREIDGGMTMKSVRLILDTDMGADCDDAGAMALLHHLADLGEVETLAVIHSSAGRMPWGVGVCAAINAWCGRPNLPLGAYTGDDVGDPVDKIAAEAISKNTERHGHQITRADEAEDALALYKRILEKEEDHSVVIVTIGHLKALRDLWESAPDLVRTKVSKLVVMGGHFPETPGKPEWNFGANDSGIHTAAALSSWPTPVVFTGYEIGIRILTGGEYVDVANQSPVACAYRGFEVAGKYDMKNGRPSWDQTAVLYSVRGAGHQGETYWELSEPGRAVIDDRGWNSWSSDPRGNHRFLKEAMPPEDLASVIQNLMDLATGDGD